MIIWTNDIHLNFLIGKSSIQKFSKSLTEKNPEASCLIISGDISSGEVLKDHLIRLVQEWGKPIYFVLGNHDYYNSSWSEIDILAKGLNNYIPNLHWLNQGIHKIDNHIICGVGGWYDAFYGNPDTNFRLNDFRLINELSFVEGIREFLLEEIRERARREADILAVQLKEACKEDEGTIIVVTHVPPYKESSLYRGDNPTEDSLPWFTSASTGAVLDRFSDNNPKPG